MLHVRNGAGEMLGILFDRYQSPLFNFYCRLTGDRALSEDLVQDVFVRILKYRHSYRAGTPVRPWIYQIARNARLDHARKQVAETTWNPDAAPAVPSLDFAQQKQETALLYRALMQLAEEKRELLILSRFQELKYEEIAHLLGCEAGAVKVRVHRALQELREIFHQLECGASRKQTTSDKPGSEGKVRIPPAEGGHEL